jgi:drug/metabolite transporter (DMT)-like permease
MGTSSATLRTATSISGDRRRGQIAVALGAICWSTAGLFQRALDVDLGTQVAGRAFFAAITLLGFSIAMNRGHVVESFRAIGRAGIAVAISIAIAMGAFITALNHTSVAHVLFIQASSPILAGLIGLVFLGEKIPRRALGAMLLALVGVAVMVGDPHGFSSLGDGLSVIMAIAFAASIVLTSHRRDVSMVPATCLAQVILVVCALPFASPGEVGGKDLLLLVAMGAIQVGLGLALFTVGARLITAPEVALISLLEVVLGPLWVLISVGERPDTATLIGGVVVVAAVVVQALTDPEDSAPLGVS